jgi:excisionase family DNA binding protein
MRLAESNSVLALRRLLTMRQVAERLSVSVKTVRRMIDARAEMLPRPIRQGGRFMFVESEVELYVDWLLSTKRE